MEPLPFLVGNLRVFVILEPAGVLTNFLFPVATFPLFGLTVVLLAAEFVVGGVPLVCAGAISLPPVGGSGAITGLGGLSSSWEIRSLSFSLVGVGLGSLLKPFLIAPKMRELLVNIVSMRGWS